MNAIVPSKIETDMLREVLDEKAREELKRRIPVRRLGTPEEIGALAAFLASDRAGYITGEMLVASGDTGSIFRCMRSGVRALCA